LAVEKNEAAARGRSLKHAQQLKVGGASFLNGHLRRASQFELLSLFAFAVFSFQPFPILIFDSFSLILLTSGSL